MQFSAGLLAKFAVHNAFIRFVLLNRYYIRTIKAITKKHLAVSFVRRGLSFWGTYLSMQNPVIISDLLHGLVYIGVYG